MFYSLPIISALIGWITNYIAVKMLFYPQKEQNFYLFRLQGVFPKRKAVLAERLGEIIAKELFSVQMIKEKIQDPQTQQQISQAIVEHLDKNLLEEIKKVNPMIAMFATPELINPIKEKIAEQVSQALPMLTDKLGQKIEEIDVKEMVRQKVINFSDDKLEQILLAVMQKELKFIEIAGGFLGFLIGLIQMFLLSI